MSNSVYTAPLKAPQEPANEHRPRPDTPEVQNGTDVPIPLAVSVRFETKAALYTSLDYWTDKCIRCERLGDTVGLERADHCHRIVFEEIDRRDAIAAEKERRRQARMRTAAAIFRETGMVRS